MPLANTKNRAGRRLLLLATFGMAIVIALCAAAATAYLSANRWVDHTLEVRSTADEWLIALLDVQAGARGYVLHPEPGARAAYETARAHERARMATLRSLVVDNPRQVELVAAVDRDAELAVERFGEIVALADSGKRSEALARLGAMAARQSILVVRSDMDEIHAEEARLLVARRTQSSDRALFALGGALLLALASMGALGAAWRMQRAREEIVRAMAAEARGRLDVLSDLALGLSEAGTPAEVAQLVADRGMRAAGADTCTLYVLDEAGKSLDLIGERGVLPEIVEKIRRITQTSGNPRTFETMRAGQSLWAENEDDYLAIFPGLAKTSVAGRRAKAFWSVPLHVEGRPVGLLGMGFYEPRTFAPDERAFVETLTHQCAQALLRATRLEREEEARQWLATTLRSIGDAVIATDAEGRITFMNAIAESLTGHRESDARGTPLGEVFRIFSEQTGEVVESPVDKVLREGTVVGLANHTVLRRKDGVELPIDDSGAPIRNEAGRLFGVVLVFRDATNEKRARVRGEFLARAGEALVSSVDYEATLATVARFAVPELADWCAVDIVEPGATVSRQVAVAHIDEAKVELARALGMRYPPDPDAQRGVRQVIRSGESELYTEIPAAFLEGAAKDEEHLRIMRELRLESAMVVPLRRRGRTFGAMTFVFAGSSRRYNEDDLAFAEDFARRAAMAIENAFVLKEAESARAQEHVLRREAELVSRAKDDFLAMVSHELRTPLNSILGWTVILRGRKPGAEVDRGLAIVERNARTQAKLIEDVLDVSRIISGKLSLNLGATNIAEAIASAVETAIPAADAKGITMTADVPDASLVITADADRLQQIVWNLLSNAVKFTPKGGGVTVRAYREGSDVCIVVNDTGEGIKAEALPLVFEPFHQADASTTRRHGGLGLGLAIVKQLVSAHGGTVRATSDGQGKGATFVVELPARAAMSAVGWSPRTAEPSAPLRSDRPSVARLEGLRLLVVDDEEDALALVTEVLRDQGAEVHVATSAGSALEQLGAVRPHVIVSDIGMPQEDGYSLIQKIRARAAEEGGKTPAVALTAYARVEDVERAMEAGFQRHIAKPVEPRELARLVAELGGR